MLAPGTFVVAVGYMTCEQSTTAVILLTLGVAMSGFQYGSGWMVNPVDIAPRYAGVIFGISNTFATVPGFVAPIVIGLITTNVSAAALASAGRVCVWWGGLLYTSPRPRDA